MEMCSLTAKTNFFEKRVSEYSLSSVAFNKQNDVNESNNNDSVSFDAEF